MLNKTGKDYDLQEQSGYTDSEQHSENKVIKPIITQTTSIYFIKIVHKIKSLNNRLKEKMEL